MGRFLLVGLVSFVMLSLSLAADTPGEEAVKQAIKTLKEKRAALKDKADQTLLDTVIKDLEERLEQVGKGDDPKKDEAFVMPRNWELRFNTGKTRPAYDPKTGVLKLTYDFADAKQLKDFEYAEDVKPTLQKGVLTIKGGGELKHVVSFQTLTVSGVFSCGQVGKPIASTGGYSLSIHTVGFSGVKHPMGVAIYGDGHEVAGKNLNLGNIEDQVQIPLKKWFVGPTTMGVEIGQIDLSGKIKEGKAGHLQFIAEKAPNQYSRIAISGKIDPDWAKEFFADKK